MEKNSDQSAVSFHSKFIYCCMKIIYILCLNFSFLKCFSQDKNAFYALDSNWQQTTLDSSKYIFWIHQIEDGNWQWDYYYSWGPLLKTETYMDHDGTTLNGRFCLYNKNGNLDSTGIFDHGKKNGSFYKCKSYSEDSIRYITEYLYEEDSLIKRTDLRGDSIPKIEKDTINNKDSEFPGGIEKWKQYLIKNLVFPERALRKNIQGQVRIAFNIDEDGNVLHPFIQKSREYSLDQESLRIIRNSGKWIPALRN